MIITQLRNDSRMTLTKISRKTSIPVSTIYDKIQSFKGDIITKHTSLLDFSKLGYNARINMLLKVERESRDSLKKYLEIHQNINSVFKVSNGYDFLMEGIFRNIKDVEEFIEDLEQKFKVEQKQVFYIIDEIKKEDFMNNKDLLEIV